MKILKTSILVFSLLAGMNSLAQDVSSVKDSASDTAKSNNMGQITNMAGAGMNFANAYKEFGQCSEHHDACVRGAAYVALGIMNLAQAKADGTSAGQAASTAYNTDASFGNGGYDPNAAKGVGTPPLPPEIANDPEIKQGLQFGQFIASDAPNKPISFDPKTNTITTPSGKTYKPSDFNNATSMAAAGMSQSSIDAITAAQKEMQEKIAKKIDKLNLNVASADDGFGSSGGGSGSGAHGANADANGGAGLARGPKLGIDRDPAQVAGMQKSFNGEPIGVAGDSIFRMMTNRYKVKESQSTFLDDAALIQK
jgi:hypothetical protein